MVSPQEPPLEKFITAQSEDGHWPQSPLEGKSAPLLEKDAFSYHECEGDNPMDVVSVRAKLEREGEMAVWFLIFAALEHAAGIITHTDETLRNVYNKLSAMEKKDLLRQPKQLATEIKDWMLKNKAKAILMFVGFGAAAYKAKTMEDLMKAKAETFINWGQSATWYVRFFGFVLLMIVRLVVSTVVPPTSPAFGIILQAATPEEEKWTAMPLFLAASTVAGATPYVLDKAIQHLSPISKFRKDFQFTILAKRFSDNWPLTCWTGPTMLKIFESVGGDKLGASLAVIFAHAAPFMGAQTTNLQRYFLPNPWDTILSQPFGMSEDLIGMAVAEGTTNPLLGSVSLIGIVVAFNFAEYFVFSERKRANALIVAVMNLCIGVAFVYKMSKEEDMQELSAKKTMIMLGCLLITNVFVVPLLTSFLTSLCSYLTQRRMDMEAGSPDWHAH